MILVNFSHPLSMHQRTQAEAVCGREIERVVQVRVQCDHSESFAAQAAKIVESVGLSPEDWQTRPIIVVPPSLAVIACACVAELHGRMGYFPPLLRLAPRESVTPPVFDVAELVNLQVVRDAARQRR